MKWNSLVVLNLENNNFTCNIPALIGSLTLLKSLHQYNKKFSGNLPSSLKSCEKLVIIDVAENKFEGSIYIIGMQPKFLENISLFDRAFQAHF